MRPKRDISPDQARASADWADASASALSRILRPSLEKKGYLRHDVKGKAHVFSAAVKREDVIKRTVGDFVERLFGGDPVPLMMHLADHSRLEGDDIERLKRLIEDTNR